MGEYRWPTVTSPHGVAGVELVLEPMAFPPSRAYQQALFDAGVPATARLAYSVAATERFTAETWIDVPSAHVFALQGARPNPARSGALAVSFSLRTNAPALLELFDVNGRRVSQRDVGSMGPGAHTLRWAEGERVRAGLYWLRLHQGTDSAMSRVVVID